MAAIRIASCAIMPKKWDKAVNADKMIRFMTDAVQNPTDLIMTPEGCLEGYVINEVIAENRGAEMLELAEPEDGPHIGRFRDFCRTHRVNALIGFAERIGDEAYNCALWLDREGETRGKYYKTHLQEGARADWPFNRAGEDIRGFDTEFGRVGVMICFDRRVPEVARCLMLNGARILLVPSYGFFRGVNDAILATRAHENQLPLVFCHPQKTAAFDAGGELIVVRELEDAVTHVEVELAPEVPDSHGMRSRRRPELYDSLTRSDAYATGYDSEGFASRG